MLLTRRTLLRSASVTPVASMLPQAGRAAAPFQVGFVYPSPVGDAGWAYQHELGRRALEAAMGGKVKTSFIENVSEEGADAERVIRKMATDGHKLVFTCSFGFMNPTVKVAQAFPKVIFEHATGYKRAKNLGTYSARYYEGRYLTGIIAGRMSKSGVIGYVAAFPIPEVVQGVNAVLLGARSVNPNATVKVVFINSWFDPGKETAAADALISQGADLITQHTDSTAIAQDGEQKGVPVIAYNSDQSKYGPKTCLTAVTHVWDKYYIDKTTLALNGHWASDDVWGGIAQGMVKLAPYGEAVPPNVRDEVQAAQDKIASGALHPFAGPVKDQAGATKIASGASLTDAEILKMDWFAEGVQGKLG